ncbi:DsbA family protein [Ornithinimicrobium sp. W1679]|uniref:DsbA family protein n=1 Tax=Ornithinimicrobium sp. W1679 TaxID=3418770 RepID=UPI003CF5E87F
MPRPPAPQVKPVAARGPSAGLIAGVVVLVVALLGVLVWAATRGGDLEAVGSSGTLPDGGGVSVGPGLDADVPQVRIYEDPQCPWCGRLENAIGEDLAELIEAGEVNVTFQIMSFLDGGLGNDSSTRGANAMLCADDAGAFLPFHEELYGNMPASEGQGWSDEQLVGFGEQAGIEGEALAQFESCVADQTHAEYVQDMQQRANEDGVSGTPTVFVDGEELPQEDLSRLLQEPGALREVLEAQGR